MFYDVTQWYVTESGSICLVDGHRLESLMQYSELKDNNGMGIYEGDIVSVNLNHRKNPNFSDKDFSMNCLIVWKNGGLFFRHYTNDLGWQCENFDVEVIGNKFENPELVTE